MQNKSDISFLLFGGWYICLVACEVCLKFYYFFSVSISKTFHIIALSLNQTTHLGKSGSLAQFGLEHFCLTCSRVSS